MTELPVIAGIGMTSFGKHLDRPLHDLAAEAISEALNDAGVGKSQINAAYMGTAAASVMTGQVLVPGQVMLRRMGIGHIPVINIENACATSATAFQQAAQMIKLGVYDIVLVAGYEKLFHEDKKRTFSVFQGAVDCQNLDGIAALLRHRAQKAGVATDFSEAGAKRSIFMDLYASTAWDHMRTYGTTQRDFAQISAKNSFHGSLNPKAQFQKAISVDDVLNAPVISDPLTLPMCSPIGDGAAALVLMSESKAREFGVSNPIRILSSVLGSGYDGASDGKPSVAASVSDLAYHEAGIGPEDLDVVELHDATAPAELMYYEYLGLADPGKGADLLRTGATSLGGKIPVNPSGGLLRKGHPIGASGAGQLVELATQLRGEAGKRQVEGARIALAENGGGFIGSDVAAIVITILEAVK